MRDPQTTGRAGVLYNIPNQLTTARLILSIVLFILIWRHLFLWAFTVYVLAAFTDWLDGAIARAYNLQTRFGRVYDPLVDKIMNAGALVFLLEVTGTGIVGNAGLNAAMVAAVISREFLVTGIRSYLEETGISFGADWLGKIKMILQCVAVGWILLLLSGTMAINSSTWPLILRDTLNGAMVAVSIVSGAHYVIKAFASLK